MGKTSFFEYDELDSTNDEAKRLVKEAVIASEAKQSTGQAAASGTEPSPLSTPPLDELYGSVVTARRQGAGKGRRGRAFFSPGGGSVYASFILRPPERPAGQLITAFAAVAVCEAIEKTTPCRPGIKWLNDIIVDGKKVCGILAEAVPHAVILGIGVNINLDGNDLPESLRGVVGTLRMDAETRERFFDALVESVFRCTENTAESPPRVPAESISPCTENTAESSPRVTQDTTEPAPCVTQDKTESAPCLTQDTAEPAPYVTQDTTEPSPLYAAPALMDAYRARSILIGKPVYVLRGDEKAPATAIGVADDGGLVVRYENGDIATLRAGEVSVRI